ncbi:hypothetical protein J2Z83_002446 [Virgibacillus natechei]|uniref:Uncharacterized protein n=1 Tax=Virgibacillus natechei TaxID=1216297 RepID=A0ABS4IHH6_9BACI|nr:hypothetical protein [Virgibacillus natechei]MBP1970328.1 hypothetical protein [Virgibacillus natechei]UZD13155.1 hypothetical protein OLD84_00825 [Virgibacillus natechei]
MTIDNNLIEQAIDAITEIEGIKTDPNAMLDDIVLVAYVFDNELLFMTAIAQIKKAMLQIVKTRDIGQPLVGNLSSWMSFHFQSQRTQKHPADLRIIYHDTGDFIRIRGFGHRHLPSDVYQKLYG